MKCSRSCIPHLLQLTTSQSASHCSDNIFSDWLRLNNNPFYYYGFFRLDKLRGFGMIGYHDAMVNGLSETVFYLKDYYVSADARGKGFGLRLTERLFRETFKFQSALGYTVLMAGNRDIHSYIGHRNPSFPYTPFSRIINQLDVRNILLTLPVARSGAYAIRTATERDISAIVALLNNEHKDRLFGKIYGEDTFKDYLNACKGLTINNYYLALDKKGNPSGVCAAWDCSSFKQTRVLHYGKQISCCQNWL